MTRNFSYLILLGTLLFGAVDALAVKAKPGVIDYVQPDGSVVKIQLHGDESFHYMTTVGDQLLLSDDKGFLEYAISDPSGKPTLSGINAVKNLAGSPLLISGKEYAQASIKNASPRKINKKAIESQSASEPKYRYSTSVFPASGEPHSIVVLVEYPDYGFSMDDPQEYYNDFLNGDNFNRDKGVGSCRQYFVENSSGQFKPTFDVYGPVMMKNNRRYYGGGQELRAPEMVVEAVNFLDPDVDFTQYDHNNDGYVDSIYIIYADRGEADSGISETVWPHSWELEEAGFNLVVDGVVVNTYGCSNELDGDTKVKIVSGIGTFTHEFCHVLGLPDLYNTVSSSDYSTPCEWSILDEGPYNGDGRVPPNMSSFERYSLGWLSPEEILCSGDYSLEYLADSNSAYIMTTEENPDEFFIMDYRLQEGWDKYLPYHGLLIWHVDFKQELWDANTPNNTRKHQCVDLIRADNNKENNDKADPFPGFAWKDEFSTKTAPALKSWDENELNVTALTDIREKDRSAYFTATATEDRSENSSGIEITPSGKEDFYLSGDMVYGGSQDCRIFDLSGRLVGVAPDSRPVKLPKGIYIVNGEKIIVK